MYPAGPSVVSRLALLLCRQGRRDPEPRVEPGPPVDGLGVEVQLRNATGPRVAEPGVERAVQSLQEAPTDRRDEGDLAHRQRHGVARPDHGEDARGSGRQRAENPPPVGRADLEQSHRLEAAHLVPLDVQGPDVVGLELETPAIEPLHLAGDAVAVAERDDVGAGTRLGPSSRHQRQRQGQRRDDREGARHGHDGPETYHDIYGFAAYGLPPSAFEMSAMAFCARTLLPASSSGGEITAMPNLPGDTASSPPPTPLFAGRPVA